MEFWRVNRPDGVPGGVPGGVPDGVPDGVKVGYGQTVAIVASDRHRDERLAQTLLSCPVAVITGWCREQTFPADPVERPIRLRAPLSAVTARVLMDYVAARLPA